MLPRSKVKTNSGTGLLNTVINSLPIELHLPGYQYCGPGTNLKKRLALGQSGINGLDSACREHDIAYDKSNSLSERSVADSILEERAWSRVGARDADYKEKAAAWLVTTGMKAKRKIGAGCKFSNIVGVCKKALKKSLKSCPRTSNMSSLIKSTFRVARKHVKATAGGRSKKNKLPRIIKVPQTGGSLSLIPILAGLSALGTLAGGVANIVRTIRGIRSNNGSQIIALENKMRELLKSVGVRFFSLSTDNSTLKCTVHCSSEIDLNVEDSIAPLLGFDKRTLARDRRHESDRVVKIMNVNTIKVECNLALGSFDNGLQSHTIHEFYPVVPPGYKIVEIPKYCVLYKLKTNTIDYVRVSLTDQNGKAIDFREGKITKPAELTTGITIAHNGLTNLFNEMKYEINSTEVQRVKKPGITSAMKGYCSYSPADENILQNTAWDITNKNANFMKDDTFSGCIPLKHVFGFCEDYKRILVNCNQQLILNRSMSDTSALQYTSVVGGDMATESVQALVKKVKVQLTRVLWKVPVVKVDDRERLRLMKIIDSKKMINCAFRNWELYEYPNLPQTSKHSWMVKTCSQVEKPRCLIIAFLTNTPGSVSDGYSGDYDACSLTNVKAYINSVEYPYEDFNESFDKNLFTMFYQNYIDFQKHYYERDNSQPCLSREKYKELGPFICIDCSRQTDDAKISNVDLRLDIEAANNFPANTAAYCLVIHDRVI
ncbi:hypothetical protein QTP88_015496 [Uroleucon formosanum]